MAPFDRHEVKSGFKNDNQRTLRNNRGLDTLDYKGNFCYEYDQLQFDGRTPAKFNEDEGWSENGEVESAITEELKGVPQQGQCGKVCKKLEGKDNCKELCADDKRNGTLVKVYVGVVLPQVAPSGESTFDLCQDGKCVKAGQVSTFGNTMERIDKPSEKLDGKKNSYLVETDVTALMIEQGWTLKKHLEAKMTSSMVGNLPDPVVSVRELGKGGTMGEGRAIRSSKEKQSAESQTESHESPYGDLLDEFSSLD